MVSIETFRQMVLTLPEVTEQPHFEKTSFRAAKKIVATLDVVKRQACIKLSVTDQNLFSLADNTIIFPVPNKWGKQGWTFIDLDNVRAKVLNGALVAAYCEVAPKKLAALVKEL